MVQTSQAFFPQMITQSKNKIQSEVILFFAGILSLSLLAQIAIPLPWTPVPITGQTLGVTLLALLWGQKRATSVFISYFLLGTVGLPIFAMGKSGFMMGPTLGYLVGMLASSFVVGYLADRGWSQKFSTALLASYIGSIFVFSFGVWGLSFFVPTHLLFVSGVLPFILGDAIKNVIASWLASQFTRQ